MVSPVRVQPESNLMRALLRSRAAWRVSVLRLSALVAWTLAAGVVVGSWASAWLAGRPGRVAELAWPLTGGLLAAVVVFVTVLVVGVLLVSLAAPSLLQLARRVDTRSELDQRLSTAYEVLRADAPHTDVARALMVDVERRSARLDVARSSGVPARRWLVVAAVIAGGLACVSMLVPVPQRASRSLAAASVDVSGSAVVEADAATIAELGRVLERVAERSRNSYLHGVAGSFGELASRMEAGSVTTAEANATVQELAQHLQAAAAEVGGRFQQTVEGILSGAGVLAAGAVPSAAIGAIDVGAVTSGPAGDTTPTAEGAAASAAAEPSMPDIYMAFDKIVAEYEYDPSSLGLRPPGAVEAGEGAPSGFYGGVLLAESDPNAAPSDAPVAGRVAGQAGGDVAGAAQQSSDSAGDAAGAGAAQVGLGSDEFLAAGVDAVEVAALPANERSDGGFSEVEMLPAVATSVARLLDRTETGSFVRSEESSFTDHSIGRAHVDVVARYFTPPPTRPGVE